MSILDKIGYGGITTVIGLLIVFVGLGIIIGSLYLMAAIFQKVEKNKAEKAEKAAKAAQETAPMQSEPAEETQGEEVTDDDELIAVIAAAIAAYDFGGKKVAIKSVRRVNGWKNAARSEMLSKF